MKMREEKGPFLTLYFIRGTADFKTFFIFSHNSHLQTVIENKFEHLSIQGVVMDVKSCPQSVNLPGVYKWNYSRAGGGKSNQGLQSRSQW